MGCHRRALRSAGLVSSTFGLSIAPAAPLQAAHVSLAARASFAARARWMRTSARAARTGLCMATQSPTALVRCARVGRLARLGVLLRTSAPQGRSAARWRQRRRPVPQGHSASSAQAARSNARSVLSLRRLAQLLATSALPARIAREVLLTRFSAIRGRQTQTVARVASMRVRCVRRGRLGLPRAVRQRRVRSVQVGSTARRGWRRCPNLASRGRSVRQVEAPRRCARKVRTTRSTSRPRLTRA